MYPLSTIAKVLNVEGIFPGDAVISTLLIDSRKVSSAATSIFFALKGERNDGHHFIAELYEKGVRNFVVSEPIEQEQFKKANFLVVPDTREALQKVAAFHREQFQIPVIGITGSNGKTIVKEWLHQLLATKFSIARSPKSYNSQVGVPLSVWQISAAHNLGIFEAGISEVGEMTRLEKIIQPTIGIITNIGSAHDQGFENKAQKIEEKFRLFEANNRFETLVYCLDQPEISNYVSEKYKHLDVRLFSWSFENQGADVFVSVAKKREQQTELSLAFSGQRGLIAVPFTDLASLENVMHCMATMLFLGFDFEIIARNVAELEPLEMRLELKKAINNCHLINDAYSSDLASLEIALDFLEQQPQHPKKALILSDILQSGLDNRELYQRVASLVAGKNLHYFIGIGPHIQSRAASFSQIENLACSFYSNTEDFLKALPTHDFQNTTILLKGARSFHFEDIAKRLEQKLHNTVLEINLDAIVHNLNFYRSLLKPDTQIMAMVKAFSYGSGSFEIASLLEYHRVNYLAVAYADEGVELRNRGVQLPIMVMNPEPSTFEALTDYALEAEIYSFEILEALALYLKSSGKSASIHLKIDTGMHRLGFVDKDVPDLMSRLSELYPTIAIKSVFSHLVGSDENQHDGYTKQQIEIFDKISSRIAKHTLYSFLRHIANSSGTVRFPEAQFDMVRLGIGLYGIDPARQVNQNLENVATLKTTVAQVKVLPPGTTIGYGRNGKLDAAGRIATINIGYADGFDRRLGNGVGHVSIHGELVPTIGNVCMDMTMIDVTSKPNVHAGDEVIIFGTKPTIQDNATWQKTIPYEVLAGISQRVKRVYFAQ